MAEAHDGTGEGVDLFLTWAGEKGELNASTAQALKTAVGKVLDVSDDAASTDLTRLDVESLLSRWETKNRTKYKEGSLNTYKVRFRNAVAMYNAWLANDPDWKTAGKSAAPASRGSAPRQRRVARKGPTKSTAATTEAAPAEPPVIPSGVRMVSYDLPLRPDLLVRLNLPVDLTKDDATRIASFVSSLAFTVAPAAPKDGGFGDG